VRGDTDDIHKRATQVRLIAKSTVDGDLRQRIVGGLHQIFGSLHAGRSKVSSQCLTEAHLERSREVTVADPAFSSEIGNHNLRADALFDEADNAPNFPVG
jgi:hypothetical protein